MSNIEKSKCKVDEYGTRSWYLNGKLHRENDLPAIESTDGDKFWYINGKYHREDGLPAVEYADGDKFWYLNGLLHRENGPAVEIIDDGITEYWINAVHITQLDNQKIYGKENLAKYLLLL